MVVFYLKLKFKEIIELIKHEGMLWNCIIFGFFSVSACCKVLYAVADYQLGPDPGPQA